MQTLPHVNRCAICFHFSAGNAASFTTTTIVLYFPQRRKCYVCFVVQIKHANISFFAFACLNFYCMYVYLLNCSEKIVLLQAQKIIFAFLSFTFCNCLLILFEFVTVILFNYGLWLWMR